MERARRGGGQGGFGVASMRMTTVSRMTIFFGVVLLVELVTLVCIKHSTLPRDPAPDTVHMFAHAPESQKEGLPRSQEERRETMAINETLPYEPPRLPSPLTVACLSSQRTVSTTAFNLVRILMERVDANSISGWEHDVVGSRPNERLEDILPKVHGKVSTVYKSHAGEAEHHQHADFVVVTYRDPYEIMCSMGRMFQPKIFRSEHKAVGKCRKMAKNEAGIKDWAGREGTRSLHINSDVLKSAEGMTEVVRLLMEKWGVQGGSLDPRSITREVMDLESPPEGVFSVANPRSELHPHHITGSGDTEGDCDVLKEVLAQDQVCRAWHDTYAAMFPEGSPSILDERSAQAAVEEARRTLESGGLQIHNGDTGNARPSHNAKREHLASREARSHIRRHQHGRGAWEAEDRSGTGGPDKESHSQMSAGEDAYMDVHASSETAFPSDKYFFCLLNGGLNDITVEMWKCIEFARTTQRVLVLAHENYNPVAAPWTPYFTLEAIPGLRTMTPYQAATAINHRGRAVSVFPSRLQHHLDPLLGPKPAQGDSPEGLDPRQPFPFKFEKLKHLKFRFENTYHQDVVVFHRQGNVGSGVVALRHIKFAESIRSTFLKRWSKLEKPYVALHLRRTDKSCSDEKMERLLQVLHRMGTSDFWPEGPIYVASDHPELPEDFREELEERQKRQVVSFTYHPPVHEQRNALHEDPDEQKMKETRRHSLGIEGLHLHDDLSPKEKHQTNIDAFVDLLLLAMSEELLTSCGGYSHLARELHQNQDVVFSVLGLPAPGPNDDLDMLLEAAAAARVEPIKGKLAAE